MKLLTGANIVHVNGNLCASSVLINRESLGIISQRPRLEYNNARRTSTHEPIIASHLAATAGSEFNGSTRHRIRVFVRAPLSSPRCNTMKTAIIEFTEADSANIHRFERFVYLVPISCFGSERRWLQLDGKKMEIARILISRMKEED